MKYVRQYTVAAVLIGICQGFFAVSFSGCSPQNDSAGLIPKITPSKDSAAASLDAEIAANERLKKEKQWLKVSSSGPWPIAETKLKKFNFGRMPVGDAIGTHTFTLKNVGDADLMLKAGQATCQCTTFSVESERVPPGGETLVTLQWKVKAANPNFRHGGPVYTNDPKNRELMFEVEGIIDEAVVVEPGLVWNVGQLSEGVQSSIGVTVASRVHEKFSVESITAESPNVRFKVRPMTPQELKIGSWVSGYSLNVTVDGNVPPGTFEDTAVLKLDVLEDTRSFKVQGTRFGVIRFLPTPGERFDPDKQLLTLGTFRAAQGRKSRIMLIVDHSESSEPLEISDIETVPSFMKVTLEPSGQRLNNSQRYLLNIEIPPGRPKHEGTHEWATFRASTNHKSYPQIKVNVSFTSN